MFAGWVFALIFGASSCQKEEKLIDECDRLNTETEFFDVSVKARVEYNDFVPYEGPIRLRLYKTYCNGKVSGDFQQSGTTDEDGYFDPHYTYTYKYENLQDKVDLEWYAVDQDEKEVLVYQDTFYYNDAEDENWLMIDVYEINLSWDAP